MASCSLCRAGGAAGMAAAGGSAAGGAAAGGRAVAAAAAAGMINSSFSVKKSQNMLSLRSSCFVT
jgi:hypothetical protein